MRGMTVAVFDNLTEGHRRAVDQRAKLFEGDLAEREQIEGVLAELQAGRRHAFRCQRPRRRVDDESVEVFSQQRRATA